MQINEFIGQYHNHPVLFIGTGISMRYLENSYTWDGLLSKVAYELTSDEEYYLELKYKYKNENGYDFPKIATKIEKKFDKIAEKNRKGKFQKINDIFYKELKKGNGISRFKLYISMLLSDLKFKGEKKEELAQFKKIRKNISSIITTNYDELIENIFEFIPLIGNNILLSNPYGSVYKIHGCVTSPEEIVITDRDYERFNDKYELIRAQLLSLFIHNPIIFMGYSIEDKNIKNLLRTIFTYVEYGSDIAEKIRNNFLLVEYEKGSEDNFVSEYDIKLENFPLIRINKIKTNNFSEIYDAIASLHLPISAMDIRKVENIVKELHEGGKIEVHITEDLDSLSNSDKVIAIGSKKTITYEYQTSKEMMKNYFEIIDESNKQIVSLIDKFNISKSQYFPIYGFSILHNKLISSHHLKEQQVVNIQNTIERMDRKIKNEYILSETTVNEILSKDDISKTNKDNAILYAIMNDFLDIDDLERYLRGYTEKTSTDYRRLLCAYDYKKFGE